MLQFGNELSETEKQDYLLVLKIPHDPQITSQERLERYLYPYRHLITALRLHYTIAVVGTNLIYLTFPIMTSNEGINTLANLIVPNITISSPIGYGIGGALSLVEVANFMLVFSPKREAILSAQSFIPRADEGAAEGEWFLVFLKRTGLSLQAGIKALREQPLSSAAFLCECSVHQSILLSFNLTWISASLVFLPKNLALNAAFPVLFWGEEYCRLYSNSDYYDGVQFFKQQWRTILQYAQNNPLTALQILAQSGSAIGIRVFPVCYYLALQAQEILGLWPPATMVIIATTLQGLGALFLPSFKYYAASQLGLQEHFTREGTLPEMSHELQRFNESWIQQNGYFRFLVDSPAIAALILMRTCLGGYLGYATSQFFHDPAIADQYSWLLTPLFALFLGAHLYFVETKRLVSIAHHNSLNLGPTQQQISIPNSTKLVASLVNICGAFSTTLSNMGLLCLVLGQDKSIEKVLILMLSLESMLNLILFNQKKCEQTIHGLRQSMPSCVGWFSWLRPPQTRGAAESIDHNPAGLDLELGQPT